MTRNNRQILAHAPQDKERVKREIESTDRAIDCLSSPSETSYELSRKGMIYGLTEMRSSW